MQELIDAAMMSVSMGRGAVGGGMGGGVAGGAFIQGGENGRLGALDYQKMGPQTLPCMGQGAAGLGINTTGM